MQWVWPLKARAGGFISFAFIKKRVTNSVVTYVDDVFATYLYTGNGGAQTAACGIDVLGKGGMVWFKIRQAGNNNYFFDTKRTTTYFIDSTSVNAQGGGIGGFGPFTSSGYNMNSGEFAINYTGAPFASWIYRIAPNFFDVVTWTGDGSSTRQFAHSLGSVPGLIIVKCTNDTTTYPWVTYHRSTGTNMLYFNNNTSAGSSNVYVIGSTDPSVGVTSTYFNDFSGLLNASAKTFVAYVFAHNTAADGMIQCSSFTSNASGNATINLGWEPQLVLLKASSTTGNWILVDSMRGMTFGANDLQLYPNNSSGDTAAATLNPSPTGFDATTLTASSTYVFMAIRRPNKPPTNSTDVFDAVLYSSNSTARKITSAVPYVDFVLHLSRSTTGKYMLDRVRGNTPYFCSTDSFAQTEGTTYTGFDTMNGVLLNTANFNDGGNWVDYHFKRAPGVFDIVCYTGSGSTSQTFNHSLAAVPEMMIVKIRSSGGNFVVYHKGLGNTQYLVMNADSMAYAFQHWANTDPTNKVFSVGYNATNYLNISAQTYMNYLFATKAGISKVGSYTGSASGSVNVDCGFGSKTAKFALIKRTDAAGDWLIVDSQRGTSYYSVLNTAAAEVNTSIVTFTAGGFTTAATGAVSNAASGANYIYLAFA
jgi:hypothetical protein